MEHYTTLPFLGVSVKKMSDFISPSHLQPMHVGECETLGQPGKNETAAGLRWSHCSVGQCVSCNTGASSELSASGQKLVGVVDIS